MKDTLRQYGKGMISFGDDILKQTIQDSGSTFLGFGLQAIAKRFTVLAIAENSITSRSITMRNNVPTNTVEKGVDMGERIKRQPLMISQTFTTGDFYIPKERSTVFSAIPDVIAKGIRTVSNSEFLNSVQNAVIANVMKNIFEKKQLLTLYTSIGVYENMVIESLTIRHTPGNTLEFDIMLREVIVADNNKLTIVDGNAQVISNVVNSSRPELAQLVELTNPKIAKALPDAQVSVLKGYRWNNNDIF